MTIKLIGAGFGRTGTLSLQAALQQLGFDKCYHMSSVITHPSHVQHWTAALDGKPVDWNSLFAGYQATVDWPGCTFYRELMAQYPDAKVLLSVRDPERWYASVYNTIYSLWHGSFGQQIRSSLPFSSRFQTMNERLIWQGAFNGRFEDKAYAIEVFNQHNAEVQRTVPPERLLVYQVSEGWEPLCRFLDVPVPTTPFPHLNDTVTFKRRIKLAGQLIKFGAGLLAGTSLALISRAILRRLS
jgi:Sulfotransferase domain